MRILADQNIAQVEAAFADMGELSLFDGRHPAPDACKQADILLVRSVTPVNAGLLKNSPIRFVGSATAGTEHIDLAYLHQQNIQFAHAPGSNAAAVVEYILTALFTVAAQRDLPLFQQTVGIVGYGNIGRLLAQRLQALNIPYLLHDPPLAASQPDSQIDWVDKQTILQEADIISLHVPLTKSGTYPTYHWVDQAVLKQLKPKALLINTARGAVIDNLALLQHLQQNPAALAILDVWEHEPTISLPLLQAVTLGTPHIAGYGLTAKLNATAQLYQAVCHYAGITPIWQPDPPESLTLSIDAIAQQLAVETLAQILQLAYPIRTDDQRLRLLSQQPDAEKYFDQLRQSYPLRPAFSQYCINGLQSPELGRILRIFGFK